MMINCLIIDDETLARQVVKTYLSNFPEFSIIAECKNPIEAYTILNNEKIDLIFLDINMPKLSGLDFIKSLPNPPLVIITTAYREYALEGFELNVIDYLNKPFSLQRFIKGINRVKAIINSRNISKPSNDLNSNDFIFIKSDKKTYRLSFSEILYIEALGDYIKITTINNTIITYMSLKKMEQILPDKIFPRIHKSFIIALDKITCIEGNCIYINNRSFAIGNSYKKNLQEIVKEFSVNI